MIKSLHSFIIAVIIISVVQNGSLLVKAQTPLPSCASVGVTSQFTCSTQCTEKGDALLLFRGANGSNECSCSTGGKYCDDDPSCADLLIFPGSAQQGCRSVCASGTTVQAEDSVRYATATSATPDQAYFVVSCRCSGVEQCSDSILFSDRVDLPECADVSITSQETCQAKCESYGSSLFLGFEYESKNGGEVSICSCTGANGNTAQYCEDLDRRAVVNVSGASSLFIMMAGVATSLLVVMAMMI
ncbi:unnamed protein product [Cylindrotheca closterium]|uniref:EGF-like domain-containing protein n=1 Tax=Cylindrotheca closterium TaxID=2856 RepID=A0AAD2G869_9STRA|nr:unnamed protein product [Cylindrotheca closterium]